MYKDIQKPKTFLKDNKVRGHILSNFAIYSKAALIKMEQYSYEDRKVDQWKKSVQKQTRV